MKKKHSLTIAVAGFAAGLAYVTFNGAYTCFNLLGQGKDGVRLEERLGSGKQNFENIFTSEQAAQKADKDENECNTPYYKGDAILSSSELISNLDCYESNHFFDTKAGKDYLKDLLSYKFDPRAKYRDILRNPEDLQKAVNLLLNHGEKSFITTFVFDFFEAVNRNIGDISFLGDGLYWLTGLEPLETIPLNPEAEKILEMWQELFVTYFDSAKKKYYSGDKEALHGIANWVGLLSSSSDTPFVFSYEDFEKMRENLNDSSSLEEIRSVETIFYWDGSNHTMGKRFGELFDKKAEDALSNKPIKLMIYRLQGKVEFCRYDLLEDCWDPADFGLRKSIIPNAYNSINHDKFQNIPGAISTLDRYFNPYSQDKWDSPEFQQVLDVAQRTGATQFIEAAEGYRH
ncbi:MAG TPA: hypothetical protein VJI46_00505 [Candidatus Nanoarchaeia archaeon]|nr:hypothetical protein [Candidatus Nanoarchaeia archaeon]